MIKVKGKNTSGGDIIILGLSDENMKRLSKGEPIKFNLTDLDMPSCDVFIFNGATEFEMKRQLFKAGVIDINKTKIKDSTGKQN